MFRQQVEQSQNQQKVYYSTTVLDLKRKLEVLGTQGAYREAKALKKKMKETQKDERVKSNQMSRDKLLNRS
jgi:hypothetical protein